MPTVTNWTWTIKTLQTLPNVVANQPNFVKEILWTLTGTDGTYTASADGHTSFKIPKTTTNTNIEPYQSLNEEDVISWVEAKLGAQGIANFQANIQGQIDSLTNPPIAPEVTPLPWENQ